MLILIQEDIEDASIRVTAYTIDGAVVAASALLGDPSALGSAVTAVTRAVDRRDDQLIDAAMATSGPYSERWAVEQRLREFYGTLNFWPAPRRST